MEVEKRDLCFQIDLQWFAKDGPGGEKTEPATAKKLNDARKDGKVAKSKELTSAFDLIVLFLVLKIFTSYVAESLLNIFRYIFGMIPDFLLDNAGGFTGRSANILISQVLIKILLCAPFFAFGVAMALAINIYQVGWKITWKPLKPKGDKFNPINGFKRFFSKDSLFELLKSIVKIGVILYVAYTAIRGDADNIFILYEINLLQAVILCGEVIINAGLKIAIVYLFIGVGDYIYQRYKFKEDMKMTKQEVKDEYKNTEGNPDAGSIPAQNDAGCSESRRGYYESDAFGGCCKI